MRILVTAGPTREPIDPVRFLSNRSTGRMGYAVAEECRRRRHDVVLITGPSVLELPRGVRVLRVETASEMLNAVRKWIPWSNVLVMAAAVSDFRPKHVSRQKLKKHKTSGIMILEKTADILKTIFPLKKKRLYVGFAAETQDILREARRKLRDKGLDLIVANDVSRKDSGFGVETNRVIFLDAGGVIKKQPLLKKKQVAGRILDWIEAHYGRL